MKKTLLLLLIIPTVGMAQPLKIKKTQSGIVSFGVRSTLSTFNGGDFGNTGIGYGGQFRVQFADRINTDWFADYITSNVEDYASRVDMHIGWSVLYYFTNKPAPKIKPYILVGHCFDWTELMAIENPANHIRKLSSAIQGGAGFHLNLTERMDLSFVSQYMFHLGSDIHAHRAADGSVEFENAGGAGLEGHLLFHIGINYKLGDLW